MVAQAPSPKQKPRPRDGALVIKRACLKGVAGTAAGPPPQRRAAELHRLPPQRVQPPRGPFAWRGWACRHEHPDQGRRTELPFAQTGTIRGLAVFHERYPNMETSMSIRTIFALTLFAAVAISSAALAQGGGGGGGGAGGGGAGGASSGAAGGASGAGGAAGTTGGATKGAPNAGTTTGSGVNSNATGQRPGGNTTNSRDNINNQDRNPRR